ncbi:MAG: hypothetical protein B5M53_09945 [Candidatus Cloacimonas sp. 4484_209]|nr:MAG: hypothetical protein B5M53_09945 [Candidatus Cloacimonas sp. 4484_209]
MSLLLQFLATKAIAPVIGTIVLLTMGEHPVSLSKPHIVMQEDSLYLSTKVNNGFTKDLLEIVKSGTPVVFRLGIETRNKTSVTHKIRYDLEKNLYIITFSERPDTIKTEDIKKMKEVVSNFSRINVPKDEIPPSGKLRIRITLDPVKLDFLKDEDFDLMTLWDYRSPQQTVEIKFEK